MTDLLAMNDAGRGPGGTKDNLFERHAHVQKLRHDIELVLHAGVNAAGVNVRGDRVGWESLPDSGNGLAEFEGSAAVAHVEEDAALSRFKEVRQQSALVVEHGNR